MKREIARRAKIRRCLIKDTSIEIGEAREGKKLRDRSLVRSIIPLVITEPFNQSQSFVTSPFLPIPSFISSIRRCPTKALQSRPCDQQVYRAVLPTIGGWHPRPAPRLNDHHCPTSKHRQRGKNTHLLPPLLSRKFRRVGPGSARQSSQLHHVPRDDGVACTSTSVTHCRKSERSGCRRGGGRDGRRDGGRNKFFTHLSLDHARHNLQKSSQGSIICITRTRPINHIL